MIKVTTKSGMTLEGTFDQINQMLKLMGETMPLPSEPHYVSTTNGKITVLSEMTIPHLNSAYLKTYENHLTALVAEVAKQRADGKRSLESTELLALNQDLFLGNQQLNWLIAEMTKR